MFVSPLSSAKSSATKLRKSVPLTGVKELFSRKAMKSPVSPTGLKRLMKTPKTKRSPASPSGIKRLMKTPKVSHKASEPASPTGVAALFASPISKVGFNPLPYKPNFVRL